NSSLANELRSQGVNDVWDGVNAGEEFRWGGDNIWNSNNKDERVKAAQELVKWVNEWRAKNDPTGNEPINVVAHSHGGNVATMATQYGLKINTLITLGTPHETIPIGNSISHYSQSESGTYTSNTPQAAINLFNSLAYPYAPKDGGVNTWVNVYDNNDKVQTGLAVFGTSGYLSSTPNPNGIPSSTKLVNMNLTGISGTSILGVNQHGLLTSSSTSYFYSNFLIGQNNNNNHK
ncbi:MAG: alpha/beta hydrolase, partial [Methylacidiphilales bacterium]|nr:alpha/beta hydrolase [Candidatus Methylacidiphilales bacterium]